MAMTGQQICRLNAAIAFAALAIVAMSNPSRAAPNTPAQVINQYMPVPPPNAAVSFNATHFVFTQATQGRTRTYHCGIVSKNRTGNMVRMPHIDYMRLGELENGEKAPIFVMGIDDKGPLPYFIAPAPNDMLEVDVVAGNAVIALKCPGSAKDVLNNCQKFGALKPSLTAVIKQGAEPIQFTCDNAFAQFPKTYSREQLIRISQVIEGEDGPGRKLALKNTNDNLAKIRAALVTMTPLTKP